MRTRRGIASVVGMVFAIIALTTTIAYISYSMGILNNFNQSVLVKNQQLTDVDKEKFQVSSVTAPNGKLDVTVANTGSLPIQFTKMWIQNTSATDWVNSYVPTNNMVSPGGVLTNIGQNIPVSINPANSYNVKLVTSRGNTQQFTMNSASASPLNIQMVFLPSTVSSGFKSELMMVVINNSTSTLTNISPSPLSSPSYGSNNTGNLVCTANSVNPPKYDTLAPGTAAIFTWDIETSGGNGGDTCTYAYTTTPPLQNGYKQVVSPPSPLTITIVNIANTPYAQNAGLVTLTYTSFKWSQDNTWNNNWQVPSDKITDFSIQMTNNNETKGGTLWFSKNTQVFFQQTATNGNGVKAPLPFFIVKPMSGGESDGISSYTPDYFQGIANQGATATIYFGAASAGSNSQAGSLGGGTWYGIIVLYGKFTVHSGDNTGGQYAQTIPFMAVSACTSPPC
ncbi:MAG: hypothetical protein KGH88_09055 [Thaumarchaeota archaeon]|nr:hypothetical protein [Nitrososphaerota archaeon]